MKKIRLIISIDTECDKDANWLVQQPISFNNIYETFKLNQKLNSLFSDSKLSLLLSPEVIKDLGSVEILKQMQNVELGTHMHLEFLKSESESVFETSMVQAEITPEEDDYYLSLLTNLFEEKFGYSPRSFRAGRYGYNSQSTFISLSKLGYQVDSSIAPRLLFEYNNGVFVDNRDKNNYPVWLAENLVGVPISIIEYGFPIMFNIIEKVPSYRLQKIFKSLKPRQHWIRPSYENLDGLIKHTHGLLKTWNEVKYGEPIINMMFHSNELYPDASPYNKSWNDVEVFITKIIHYVEWLEENYEVKFSYLSDIEVKA